MKRIKLDLLQPGDIVLTASPSKLGKTIRMSTGGRVSHAMICVQHGSIIDSTSAGVHARNLQRELFERDEEVFAFRVRNPLSDAQLAGVIDFARSQIGTRYSKIEAARSVLGGPKPRNDQLFCSWLVARAYASIGLDLVADKDYCTPEDLRVSPLLYQLSDITEIVSEAELAAWRKRPNPPLMMQTSQNAILAVARRLDASVENFSNVDRLVEQHPEWDEQIAGAYRESGYLEMWKTDFEVNPWHYDVEAMDALFDDETASDLRAYSISTIREIYSGGRRFAVNLRHYRTIHRISPRQTTALLITLYEQLVRNHELRCETAIAWLQRHFPEDVDRHLELVTPHSELWFAIVDRVEPNLGRIARISISRAGSADVCSSCGDPARDYRLLNGADAMPGVPSLRLCDDCVNIRRGMGERLEPLNYPEHPTACVGKDSRAF
jgi:hypothetical protein